MTEIKVGDTVRVKAGSLSARQGHVFEVTEIVKKINLNHGLNWFVLGDENDRGVWGEFVEFVSRPKGNDEPWRYNDHIVVYPETRDQGHPYNNTLGRGVTILNETPLPKIYTRWENRPEVENDEITAAARAYFEAHPLPKPAWHSAKESELWEITTHAKYENVPAFVIGDRFYMKSAYGTDDPDSIGIEHVVDARRIYPEPSE